MLLGQRGRHDLAVDHILRAVAIEPSVDFFHCNFAFAYSSLGRLPESVATYRRALQIKPDNAAVLFDLGVVLQRLGEDDEAIAVYQSALRVQPDLVNALVNLGNALRGQGNTTTQAAACVERGNSVHWMPPSTPTSAARRWTWAGWTKAWLAIAKL